MQTEGTTRHRLVLVRHARAVTHAASDRARRLTERGRAEAADAGAWLARGGIVADHALVSSADRADETWRTLAGAAGWDVEPHLEDALYTATEECATDLLRAVPEQTACVVLVGHNPTVGHLAQVLDDGDGDADATSRMAAGFPPAAVAVFGYDGPWAELDHGAARLTGFHVGRG